MVVYRQSSGTIVVAFLAASYPLLDAKLNAPTAAEYYNQSKKDVRQIFNDEKQYQSQQRRAQSCEDSLEEFQYMKNANKMKKASCAKLVSRGDASRIKSKKCSSRLVGSDRTVADVCPTFCDVPCSIIEKPPKTPVQQGKGVWKDEFEMKGIPIHSMLLTDGQILSYGTDNNGRQGAEVYYQVWNWNKGIHGDVHQLRKKENKADMFCSTLNIDPSNGNVIIMGGDVRKPKSGFGINAVLEYNVKTEAMRSHPKGDMHYERWYATSINLPNGEIFVIGGADDGSNDKKKKKNGSPFPEVYSPDKGFRVLTNAKVPNIANNPDESHWWYPHSYVNSKGDIIVMGPKGKNADIYRIGYEGKGSISQIGKKPFMAHPRTPSIMFRTDEVVFLDDDGNLWIADISDSSRVGWKKINDIGHGRTNGSMALLPDGRVAIAGGNRSASKAGNQLSTAEKSIQIWDPAANKVMRGGEEKNARLYHSNLLVLPDGTLASAGGGAPGPVKNRNGQLYFPEYMSARTRPIICDCPRNVNSGDRFTIKVDEVSEIAKVTATKSGASSHSRNCDTRWLDLDFEIINKNTLRVKAEGNTIMIGGLWMVNLIDKDGVPSEAWLMGVDMASLP